jgi:UDP-3-O-[3-hydroxymyristoyl] glucosamine N-acyltransferase
VRLAELAEKLGCSVRGSGDIEVRRGRGIGEAEPGDLTFLANPKYAPKLAATRASAIVVAPEVTTPLPSLLSPNPYLTFAQALPLLHPARRPQPGVHRTAHVDPSAVIGPEVTVGAFAVVGARCRVGARTVLHAHVVVYDDVEIGEDCLLHSGVHVREGCRLGKRVVLQNGVVIGGDGFGFAKDSNGRYQNFPQVGIVVIEDDVEIQANTTVDRAALGETRIGRGTKIDNLVQVAHSVTIGEDSILCAQVGISGSTRVGKRVTLTGQVGVVGHLEIGDGAIATAQSGIAQSVPAGALVSGYPAIENRSWLRSVSVFARLPELLRRLRAIEQRLGLRGAARE